MFKKTRWLTLKILIFARTNFRENLFSREFIFDFDKNREIREILEFENLFLRNIPKIKKLRKFLQNLAEMKNTPLFINPVQKVNLHIPNKALVQSDQINS